MVSMCRFCEKLMRLLNIYSVSANLPRSSGLGLELFLIYIVIDSSSIHSILSICNKNWSSQAKDTVLAGLVNVIWVVWYCRNKLRFEDKKFQWGQPSSQDSHILNFFSINAKHCKAPITMPSIVMPSILQHMDGLSATRMVQLVAPQVLHVVVEFLGITR